MGGISGLLGTAGGASGTGYSKPSSANIQSGVTTGQTAQAYNQNQQALGSQQALLQALQAQQGLSSQTNVYNQQQALANQQAAVNGVGNQANAYSQAQRLANQQANVNGVGAQQGALNQQQTLNQQLAANNGAANVGSAYAQTQGLANQLGASNGVGNLSSALGSQQALASQQQGTVNQLQGIANGTGPNPAMAALNQQTGQNVANQAALMAGQRGAGSNVGLIARQAAQQGAATQQQAVGQGATLQAQQSLNALGQIGAQQQAIGQTQQNVANIAQSQVGLTQAQQQALASQAANQVAQQQTGTSAAQTAASNVVGQQQAQQAQLANQAAIQVGQQQSQQAQLAGQANTIAGQQIGATTANTQAQQSEQQILQNALAAQNNANVGMQSNINNVTGGLTQTQMQGQQGVIGGLANGAGAVLGTVLGPAAGSLAKGGMVESPKHYDYGGPVDTSAQSVPSVDPNSPQSPIGKFLKKGIFQMGNPNMGHIQGTPQNGAQALNQGITNLGSNIAMILKNPNQTPASPSDAYTGQDVNNSSDGQSASYEAPQEALAAKGGLLKKNMTSGGPVKADSSQEKAVKSGNSYDNDKIPAYLSEGEIVIPRSVTQSKDPIRGAADFVSKVLAKKRIA